MEDATNRHSQYLAASALREAATPCPVPLVARVHNRTPSGKQKEGLLPTGKNFFGFIADTCHHSYRSNGKSTSLAATAPEETTSIHPPASGGRLGWGPPHPDTDSLPQHSPHRYPSLIEDATNRHSQRLAAPALREAATPCPVPMVARVHNRTPSGKQKEGLLPTGKNFFGFIAETCHRSYKSNAKTTSLAATAPEETTSSHPLSGCDLSKIAKNAHARLTLPRAQALRARRAR